MLKRMEQRQKWGVKRSVAKTCHMNCYIMLPQFCIPVRWFYHAFICFYIQYMNLGTTLLNVKRFAPNESNKHFIVIFGNKSIHNNNNKKYKNNRLCWDNIIRFSSSYGLLHRQNSSTTGSPQVVSTHDPVKILRFIMGYQGPRVQYYIMGVCVARPGSEMSADTAKDFPTRLTMIDTEIEHQKTSDTNETSTWSKSRPCLPRAKKRRGCFSKEISEVRASHEG